LVSNYRADKKHYFSSMIEPDPGVTTSGDPLLST
jgi:hypothetical protein